MTFTSNAFRPPVAKCDTCCQVIVNIKQSTPGLPHPQDDPVSPPVWDDTGACWWHHCLTLVSVGTNQRKHFSAKPPGRAAVKVLGSYSPPPALLNKLLLVKTDRYETWDWAEIEWGGTPQTTRCVGVWGLLRALRTSSLSFSTSSLIWNLSVFRDLLSCIYILW